MSNIQYVQEQGFVVLGYVHGSHRPEVEHFPTQEDAIAFIKSNITCENDIDSFQLFQSCPLHVSFNVDVKVL